MEERNDSEKIEEVMLPGFRFHPTDEELVGFYLKRKIQQRPLLIELIKQIDIYKYDPWDLPKLGSSGEKEWYFYCPRDRKYRNSARPNRVTGAGFWKATGTDRPIYSSDGTKCIGLKKSLVFYKGRAAKGVKTDWMMHEFRLPSLNDNPPPTKRLIDKTIIPPNDSWAICRIFKKTNSTAQRALSLSSNNMMIPPLLSETNTSLLSDDHNHNPNYPYNNNNNNNFPTKFPTLPSHQYSSSSISNNNNNNNNNISSSYPNFEFVSSCKPLLNNNRSFSHLPILAEPPLLSLPPLNTSTDQEKCRSVDLSSILLNMSSSVLGDFGLMKLPYNDHSLDNLHAQQQQQLIINNYPQTSSHDHQMQGAVGDQFGHGAISRSNVGSYPLSLSDLGKASFVWDSSSSCPSDVSSTTNCYT